MNKVVKFGPEARKKIISGINTVSNAVTATLGPNGRNVIYTEYGEVRSTKDGVSVAKQISNLEDPIENLGAEMIKQASIKTATNAGDGTTTSTLLAQSIINEGISYSLKENLIYNYRNLITHSFDDNYLYNSIKKHYFFEQRS